MILQTKDRRLAIRIGKNLSSERFFHDVSYETQLVDSSVYVYEFTNRTLYTLNTTQQQSSTSDSWSESESASQSGAGDLNPMDLAAYNNLPNGIITDLTHCYVPTCWDIKPCYSPTCPKRLSQVKK